MLGSGPNTDQRCAIIDQLKHPGWCSVADQRSAKIAVRCSVTDHRSVKNDTDQRFYSSLSLRTRLQLSILNSLSRQLEYACPCSSDFDEAHNRSDLFWFYCFKGLTDSVFYYRYLLYILCTGTHGCAVTHYTPPTHRHSPPPQLQKFHRSKFYKVFSF